MNRCTTAYLILMLAVFPLITLGDYYSILFIKWAYCLIMTAAFMIVAIAAVLTGKSTDILKLDKEGSRTATEKAFLAFAGIFIISLLAGLALCSHKKENLFGFGGRYLGVIVLVLCMAAMLAVSMHFRKGVLVSACAGAGAAVVFILQIVNSLGYDPLGMKTGIIDSQADLFISTLGNLNFNATFDCIIIGAAAANLMVSKGSSTGHKAAMTGLIALGIAGAVSCRSAGAVLGLAAVAAVVAWYALWKKGLIGKAARICATAAFAVIAILFVIWVVKSDGHAGHNRVFIWKEALEMFAAFPLQGKLFGCGINEFQYAIYDFCGNEMTAEGYNVFTDAHSEYVQALDSVGIIGFCGYFGMMIVTISEAVRRTGTNPLALITVAVTGAFLAQGIVYGPQITTTPIMFTLTGVFWSRDFRNKSDIK